jgi:hypothetical protein
VVIFVKFTLDKGHYISDWLHCIVGHRKKNMFTSVVDDMMFYDIVGGKIADDRTNEALECISFVESEKIWIN